MDTDTKAIYEKTNQLLKTQHLSDEDRLKGIEIITDGICTHCGSLYLPCYCMRDE